MEDDRPMPAKRFRIGNVIAEVWKSDGAYSVTLQKAYKTDDESKGTYTLFHTDILNATASLEKDIKQEEGGTHAEEVETSIMLFIAPEVVDMKKAVKDYHPSPKGGLTRNPNGEGAYSASGIYGDATLATRKKGEIMVNAMLDGIVKEIEALRSEK